MEAGQPSVTEQSASVRPPWQFKPGVSGNPSGRRRKTDAERAVEKLTKAQAQQAIERLMGKAIARVEKAIGSKDEQTALRAALDILDRSLGKATQRVEANVNGPERAVTVTVEMLQAAARRLIASTASDAVERPTVVEVDAVEVSR